MATVHSLRGVAGSLQSCSATELAGLLRQAEQSRSQVLAFIGQVDAELRRRTGPTPSAA